ncbi:hypothetical protein [Pelomonas sp. Root1237]|uniref:hypothetical protein n=1 Tax=Pelomonas sp. Root1237 TaxID=1736434 RepID=UPI000AC5E4D0|nr:hypothetical protein [Pelomonas sp. Root1237]
MSMDENNTFETNTFGFNLPCRQFVIAAERTKERRLPMVDEFILRTLLVVKSISADRLARFFGFEGRDLGIAISDLQSRSLVLVDGDNLSLHPSAKEMFRTSSEDAPTITVAEPLNADVWFDLVTKHMVSGRGLRNVQHLIPLPLRQQMDEAEARAAFHDNFRDYLRIARNDQKADQWSLYSILDVHAGRYSFVQIGGSERLTLQGPPRLESQLNLRGADSKGRGKQLTEAMSAELRKLDHVNPSQASFNEFARMFNHRDWLQWFRSEGHFDLAGWFQQEMNGGSADTVPLVGYPYVERNRRAIAELLEDAPLDFSGDHRWQTWWLRPGGSLWGATEDVPATLEVLRGVIRARAKRGTLSSVVISPASVTDTLSKTFARVFDMGVRAPTKKVPTALEVIIIGERVAVVSVMVALSASVCVPIGYATNNEARVRRIAEQSGLDELIREGTRLWPQAGR